jgi:enamine deaminase RidA (YjgF/YER057c/UK114 family)
MSNEQEVLPFRTHKSANSLAKALLLRIRFIVNIFLKNLSDIEAVNEVYTTFFPDSSIARTAAYAPARTTVAASALPMDALVQIDAVVSNGEGTPPLV